MQRTGVGEVRAALDRGEEVTVVLVGRGWQDAGDADVIEVVEAARQAGAQVVEATDRDLWRMSAGGDPKILGLVGRRPDTAEADLFVPGRGVVWVLAGLRYPSNVGYVIRTAEVSGAGAVVVDDRGLMGRKERAQALRVSMGAHRFLPVHWVSACAALEQAKAAGWRRVLLEDDGPLAPWDVDLTGDLVLVVGAEDEGTPQEVRALCDEIVRIPMAGFVPSYSVQAPVAAVAVERLRQLDACVGGVSS